MINKINMTTDQRDNFFYQILFTLKVYKKKKKKKKKKN